jgi:hypothetical protein
MAMTTATNEKTLQLPTAAELEARLRATKEEATALRRLLRTRRDLDAAAEAERRRAGADARTAPPVDPNLA